MSEKILTGTVAPVPFGNKSIDGILGSDGLFYIAVPQIADAAKTSRNTASRDFKRLMGKDFKTSKMRTEFNTSVTLVVGLLEFERLLAKLDRSGNIHAQDFRDDLVGLSLHQLFCDAFGLKFGEEDRQEWLILRQESKELFWELARSVKGWVDSRICTAPEFTYYANAFDCLNQSLFGQKSKQIRESIGLDKSHSLTRDHFGRTALRNIGTVQGTAARKMAKDSTLKPIDAIKQAVEVNLIEISDFRI